MVGKINPNAPQPQRPDDAHRTQQAVGDFGTAGEHKFAGMTFTAKEWKQFMDQIQKNFSDAMNKTMERMRKKMKEDWKRGAGEDVD